MTQPKEDYREVLRRRYSETHTQASQPLTADVLRYNDRVYRATFGPLLPADRGAAIFELGCGAGSFLHYLHGDGYAKAVGVDSDPASVETAKKLGIQGAELGDALERLTRDAGKYDAIVAIDVLEHFTKDELFPLLSAVKNALKPGGTFIWRAPNAESAFFGRLRYGDLTHELAFTRQSAYQLMTAAGFDSVTTIGEEPVITGARSLLRAALWSLIKLKARVYLYAESCVTDALLESNLIVRARRP
ncbi:MAG: class I SAM-dependent methyltransferase [Elusimicrobiota bacterium]